MEDKRDEVDRVDRVRGTVTDLCGPYEDGTRTPKYESNFRNKSTVETFLRTTYRKCVDIKKGEGKGEW